MSVVFTLPTSQSVRLTDLRKKRAELHNAIFEACCKLQSEPEKVDLQQLMQLVHRFNVIEAECRKRETPSDLAS